MMVKSINLKTKVALIYTVEQFDQKTYKIADDLRAANDEVILDTFLLNNSLKSQLRRANKNNCNFAIIIGNREIDSNKVLWKDLGEQGEQQLLDIDSLLDIYKNL
jgi:histidyl-tRNA synthetase